MRLFNFSKIKWAQSLDSRSERNNEAASVVAHLPRALACCLFGDAFLFAELVKTVDFLPAQLCGHSVWPRSDVCCEPELNRFICNIAVYPFSISPFIYVTRLTWCKIIYLVYFWNRIVIRESSMLRDSFLTSPDSSQWCGLIPKGRVSLQDIGK